MIVFGSTQRHRFFQDFGNRILFLFLFFFISVASGAHYGLTPHPLSGAASNQSNWNLFRKDNSVYDNTICEFLDQEQCRNYTSFTSIQFISQRDVQLNLTIFDATYIGFGLNKGLFDTEGYISDTVSVIPQLLSLGFTFLQLDLYWNEDLLFWQLCPFDIAAAVAQAPNNANYTLTDTQITANNITCSRSETVLGYIHVVDLIERFIKSTGTELTTYLLRLQLNLHSLNNAQSPVDPKRKAAPMSQCLAEISNKYIMSRLYTPTDLTKDRQAGTTYGINGLFVDKVSGFPKTSTFLLDEVKTVIVSYSNISMLEPSRSTYPQSFIGKDNVLFFNSSYKSLESTRETPFPYKSFSNSYQQLDVVSIEDLPTPNCSNMSVSEFRSKLLDDKGNLAESVRSELALKSDSLNIAVEDNQHTRFTNSSIQHYIECGFMPILSSPAKELGTLIRLANSAIWSWRPDQPSVPQNISEGTEGDNNAGLGAHGTFQDILNELKENRNAHTQNSSVNINVKSAWRCALLDTDGWRTANCFESHPVLCAPKAVSPTSSGRRHQNGDDVTNLLYKWSFGSSSSYFTAQQACPYSDYEFSIPRTSLQDTSARLALKANGSIPYPVWIDLNSISVKDCWVSGGPLAACPYTPNNWTGGKVAEISVVGAVIFILFLIMFILSLDKVPIRHSEGKFKKLITKFNENQYQGVPS